jgi:thermitase
MTGFRGLIVLSAAFISFVAMGAEFKQGEVIVKYRTGVVREFNAMNDLYTLAGVKNVRHLSSAMGLEHLILNESIKVEDVVAMLRQNPLVEYAQPNYILNILPVREERAYMAANFRINSPCWFPGWPPGCDDNNGGGGEQPSPSKPVLQDPPGELNPPVADPLLDKLYGMKNIGAIEAWNTTKGSKQMVVAVIDTGIDYNHEDLSLNLWHNPAPTEGDNVGYDFVHNDGLPYDDQGHGTHTSGTVGGVGGNGKGVSGVNQRVSIMALKFLDAQGSGTTSNAIRAIDYGIKHGAKVMSNSWGGPSDEENTALSDAVVRARDKGVLFVAAAGNEGHDNDGSQASYPAALKHDNMLSVAALDSSDQTPYWSNYGATTVHVGAPGVNILSSVPGNQYKQESGTSMACPHVAGAAALVWSMHPSWNYKQVKKALMATVDQVQALQGKTITGGRINVSKALRYTE